MENNKKIALVLAIVTAFLGLGLFVVESAPRIANAVYFGGLNTAYVPAIGNCPEHIWVMDYYSGTTYAVTDFGTTTFDNGNTMIPGVFVLGNVSVVPNPPCLIQIVPPVPLPYPLYNLFYEGTS